MRLSNGVRYLAVAAALLVSGNLSAQSTATLTGRVTDDSGAALSGVQVVVTNLNSGAQTGGLTQNDGSYRVPGLRVGASYRIEARMIGYGLQFAEVTLSAGQTRTVDFRMSQEAVAIDALEVFATRAVERKTPVAFTNVQKVQIQQQLGSQDLPMVLNVTPSVYATMQGGGAGDARINIRGFDQRNTAVMINGVPVNDMENGWVYWSNWDGLGDAATSIQVQRGLSAINLATPSIGGTLNVITDPSAQNPGISYKQEFGTAKFLKETFTFNTGEHNGFSFTGNVVRKTGDGLFETNGALATWTDAWAYYAAAAWQINAKNRLEFYAVGAPQSHGQNLYKLNAAQISHDFAKNELGYSQAALDAIAEAGRFWSPNVNVVDPSYTEERYASTGPQAGLHPRHSPDYINERENYFHKPQVNLNYYAYFGNGLTWSTVAYYSGGMGGGSGTLGSLAWDYTYKQRVADWNGTIARNRSNADGHSSGFLRSSVNNQWTFGTNSKLL
ncbi:MAG: carboxypeptidase regulatory-like domain-containing protein, partial [Gemmatimonadota bacterium]